MKLDKLELLDENNVFDKTRTADLTLNTIKMLPKAYR